MSRFILILLTIVFVATCTFAKPRYVNGRTFEMTSGVWYQIETYDDWEVDNDKIVVKFESTTSAKDIAALNASEDMEILRVDGLGYHTLGFTKSADPLDKVDAYLASALVDVAETVIFGKWELIPNDHYYPNQWHLPGVNMPAIWSTETGDPDVVIGIIDSGCDMDHEDLDANIEAGWDFEGGDNDPSGTHPHGTQVAGIICAVTSNDELGVDGVAGVAGGWCLDNGCTGLIIKVGDGAPNTEVIAAALEYAMEEGVEIITMSLSCGQRDNIDDNLEEAYNAGIFIDCASGNSDQIINPAWINYPARSQYVFAVGASDDDGLRAEWGPPGLTGESRYGAELMVNAPGEGIWSTKLNDTYGSGTGTSFAAPIVAGVAGLLLSCDPTLTRADIEEALCESACKSRADVYSYSTQGTYGGWNEEMGYGIVDAWWALAYVSDPDAPTNLSIGEETVPSGSGHSELSWTSSSHPDIEFYRIYREEDQTGVYTHIGSTLSNVTSFVDEDYYPSSIGQAGGTVHHVSYKVKAEDVDDRYSPFSSSVSDLLSTVPEGDPPPDKAIPINAEVLPTVTELLPSFPNPFNAMTELRFSVSEATNVRYVVFDLLGRKVLENDLGQHKQGYHTNILDMSDMSAGVYFTQVQIGNYSSTQKIVLLK